MVYRGLGALSAWLIDRRILRRNLRALGAVREAAEDDELFAVEHVDAAIRRIFTGAFPQVVAADAEPEIQWELLLVVNRPGHDEDRVDVRVRARARHRPFPWFRSRASRAPTPTPVDERWTLRPRDGRWELASRGGNPRSAFPLKAPLIATPTADEERLTADSLRELAASDQPFPFATVATGDMHAELLDRSLIDARYTPDLLHASITRIVEAWELTSIGNEAPMRAVALAPAVDALLFPRQDPHVARLMVHDLRLVDLHVKTLGDALARVEVVVRGRRYLVAQRDGQHRAGAPHVEHTMHLDWLLTLDDPAPTTWILATTSDPFTAPEPPLPSIHAANTVSAHVRRIFHPRTWRASR